MATITQQVLDELKEIRKDIATIHVLLIGSPDKPDQPGAMERLRRLEEWKGGSSRTLKWVGALLGGALLLDIFTRFLSWYTGQ